MLPTWDCEQRKCKELWFVTFHIVFPPKASSLRLTVAELYVQCLHRLLLYFGQEWQ